jgi:hypothetical protein
MKKQIVIMTKSLKDKDYCVAGIDTSSGKWIRLVSTKDGGAFPKELFDDSNINVLDVIEVQFKSPEPYKMQKENWLIDETKPIVKLGSRTLNQVLALRPHDKPKFIFGNDKGELAADEVKGLDHSLEMLYVRNLAFDTSLKGDGRHHHKVVFEYNGTKYHLCLTDPKFRIEKLNSFVLPTATIVVSIPPLPYGESELYYKFVAKVFYQM